MSLCVCNSNGNSYWAIYNIVNPVSLCVCNNSWAIYRTNNPLSLYPCVRHSSSILQRWKKAKILYYLQSISDHSQDCTLIMTSAHRREPELSKSLSSFSRTLSLWHLLSQSCWLSLQSSPRQDYQSSQKLLNKSQKKQQC